MRFPIATLLLALAAAVAGAEDAAAPGRAVPIEGRSLDLPRAFDHSALVVQGTLAGSRVEWVGKTLFTFHELQVERTFKATGRAPGERITIAVPGGARGRIETRWPGAPQLARGDRLVFFGGPLGTTGAHRAVGSFRGLVPVEREGESDVVRSGGSVEPLEAFVERVRQLSVAR